MPGHARNRNRTAVGATDAVPIASGGRRPKDRVSRPTPHRASAGTVPICPPPALAGHAAEDRRANPAVVAARSGAAVARRFERRRGRCTAAHRHRAPSHDGPQPGRTDAIRPGHRLSVFATGWPGGPAG